jgi:hypothetical protein
MGIMADQKKQQQARQTELPLTPAATAVAELSTTPKAVTAYEEDAGGGFEGTGAKDYAIPLLVVLQSLSPQCIEDNAAYLLGAKSGSLMNSVTRELFNGKAGVSVIPVHRANAFVEWVPRSAGGGLVAVHQPGDKLVAEATKDWKGFGKITLPNGHELVETFSMFALMVRDSGQYDPIVINFSSSGIKAYKGWMTRAKSITFTNGAGVQMPFPLWAHKYRLTTEAQKNAKGSWHMIVAQFDGASADAARIPQDHPLYQAAKGFRDLATSGTVKVAMETAQPEADDLPGDPDKL